MHFTLLASLHVWTATGAEDRRDVCTRQKTVFHRERNLQKKSGTSVDFEPRWCFFVLNIDAQTYSLLANRWLLVCPSFPLSVRLFVRSLRLPSVNEGDHCLLQSRSLVYIYRCLTCCHLCKSWSGSRRPSVLNDLRHRLARNKKIICSRQSQDMCTVWKYSVLTAKHAPHLIHSYAHADSFADVEKQT